MSSYNVLFCASEVYPLIKTGGLADVAGSLPHALHKAGHDVKIILPAYQEVLAKIKRPSKVLVETWVYDYSVRVSQTILPGTRVPVWLVECAQLYDRPGNPYLDAAGNPWPDNALRFAVFNRIIVSLAKNQCGLQWQPHIVHCNDWQTGLVPALLQNEHTRPATVFTIHNLAYQGIFDRATFEFLKLPEYFWQFERLEFYNDFSFIKGGLVYSDRINTVSPNYAREITTEQFGNGLHGLLAFRAERLSGIINGIDTQVWNPGTDKLLARKFNRQHLQDKCANKTALQQHFSLKQDPNVLLMAIVSRLAEQKGIDMLLEIMPELVKRPLQLLILGSGDKHYEHALQTAMQKWPEHIAAHIGYDEELAHLMEGGSDVFVMPSRFEPCGLNQLYSQRYGSLPLVTPVGGLFDTVIDASDENINNGTATGFVLDAVTPDALLAGVDRCLSCFTDKQQWTAIIKTAMQQDFSWVTSANAYTQLYEQALRDNPRAIA